MALHSHSLSLLLNPDNKFDLRIRNLQSRRCDLCPNPQFHEPSSLKVRSSIDAAAERLAGEKVAAVMGEMERLKGEVRRADAARRAAQRLAEEVKVRFGVEGLGLGSWGSPEARRGTQVGDS